MAKMKVAQVLKAGADFELVESEVPVPGPGQVLVKVEAKSLRRICGLAASLCKAGLPARASDSEDTMKFAMLTGVRPIIENTRSEKVAAAYARVNRAHPGFRVVLTM